VAGKKIKNECNFWNRTKNCDLTKQTTNIAIFWLRL